MTPLCPTYLERKNQAMEYWFKELRMTGYIIWLVYLMTKWRYNRSTWNVWWLTLGSLYGAVKLLARNNFSPLLDLAVWFLCRIMGRCKTGFISQIVKQPCKSHNSSFCVTNTRLRCNAISFLTVTYQQGINGYINCYTLYLWFDHVAIVFLHFVSKCAIAIQRCTIRRIPVWR